MSDDRPMVPGDAAAFGGPDFRTWSAGVLASRAGEVRQWLDAGATAEEARDAFLAEHPEERLVGVFAFMDALDLTHAEARRLVLGDLDLTEQFLDAMVEGIRRGEIDGTYREFDPTTGEVGLEVRSNEKRDP